MSAPYQALAKKEKARAAKLSDAARVMGEGAISNTLATAAVLAVDAVQKDNGRGAISEPAADLRDMRTDYRFLNAKSSDMNKAKRDAYNAILAAIQDGYEYDATERAKVIVSESEHLRISVDISAQELSDMQTFPINGLTAMEWATKLTTLLSYAIDETTAKPLSNGFDVRALPTQLFEQAKTHGGRLASIVNEAFFAGTKASMLALKSALIQ